MTERVGGGSNAYPKIIIGQPRIDDGPGGANGVNGAGGVGAPQAADVNDIARDAQAAAAARDTHLAGAARPGRKNFLDSVKDFFGFIKRTIRTGVPDKITVAMPDNTPVTVDKDYFDKMLDTVPRFARKEIATGALPAILHNRLVNGQNMLTRILNGEFVDALPPTEEDAKRQYQQNIADIAVFLQMKAAQCGKAFVRGAFSIEDPQGRLAEYLENSPEKYLRSSTHLTHQQGLFVDGHLNVHRGIDVEASINGGLLANHANLVFASVPDDPQHGVNRRLWIKPETHGCRISTLNSADEAKGMWGLEEKAPVREITRQDKINALGHFKDLIASHISFFDNKDFKQFKERVPDTITKKYDETLAGLEPIFNDAGIRLKIAMGQLGIGDSKKPKLTLGEMICRVTDLKNSAELKRMQSGTDDEKETHAKINVICDAFLTAAYKVVKDGSIHGNIVLNDPSSADYQHSLAEAKARLGEEVMLNLSDLGFRQQ